MASTRRTGLRLAVAAHQWFVDRVRSAGTTDRGDVPGWVLVTLMTAGIVTLLWATADGLLKSLFEQAVNGVRGSQ